MVDMDTLGMDGVAMSSKWYNWEAYQKLGIPEVVLDRKGIAFHP